MKIPMTKAEWKELAVKVLEVIDPTSPTQFDHHENLKGLERMLRNATIPLTSAYLCANCDKLGANSRTCPDCGSFNLLSLAKVLGGIKTKAPRVGSVSFYRPSRRPIPGVCRIRHGIRHPRSLEG